MCRYAAPQKGRYREHWQLSVEAIGSDDPAVDAEIIQLYDELADDSASATGRAPQLDRRRELPARVPRAALAWLDEHESELDADARAKRATSPLRVFDVKDERVQEVLARRADDRRVALRRLPGALRRRALLPRCDRASPTSSCRRSCAGSTTTRARRSSSWTRPSAPDTICGGGRYDGLIEEIGGPPTPASASGRASSGCSSRRAGRSPGQQPSTPSSWWTRAARARRCCACSRSCERAGLAATPTTPAARARVS